MKIAKKHRKIYCGLSFIFSIESFKLLGMLAAMDFSISRVVQYLKDEGYYEDTVIVFTSDVSLLLWGSEKYTVERRYGRIRSF